MSSRVFNQSTAHPEGTLDPSLITANTPVIVAVLYESYFVWNGKKVTLEGYPRISCIHTMIIEDELRLVSEPGEREPFNMVRLVSCQLVNR